MGTLDQRAVDRISGPAWADLKDSFWKINNALLGAAPDACGELTTIYVKYLPFQGATNVFAVVWLKTSKQIVVGLALPDREGRALQIEPFPGTRYKGLTRYFAISPGDAVPEQIESWAEAAYRHVMLHRE